MVSCFREFSFYRLARLPLCEKRAHWEPQFWASQRRSSQNTLTGQGLPMLSMSAKSNVTTVTTHIGSLNQILMVWKTITFKNRNWEEEGCQ